MEIKTQKKGNGDLIVSLNGELDECSAVNAKNILDKIISDNSSSKKVVFDLKGLSFMDSTGIGLLIGRYKKLKTLYIPSYISNACVAVEKVIELSGLYGIMPKI